MSTDSHTTKHVPIWGVFSTGGICILGNVSVDRTGPTTTYMAQHDDQSATFENEVQAAAWLEQQFDESLEYVLIGRVFRPDATYRVSSAESVRGKRTGSKTSRAAA